MAKQYQWHILKANIKLWNQLRQQSINNTEPVYDNQNDFDVIDLSEIDLCGENLHAADFHHADLRGTNFSRADLGHANLIGARLDNARFINAKLIKAKLSLAKLNNADLKGADLENADFSMAHLNGANFSGATFKNTDFSGAYLRKANFCDTDLAAADISWSHLDGANLEGADLSGKDLSNMSLRGANLRNTNLARANLNGSDLSLANLNGADLSEATLHGTNLSHSALVEANLEGSSLVKCNIYGLSAWNIKINTNTKQHDLVISRKDEPKITIDHIEIAHFISLLLGAKKIRSTIDTISLKFVLILGLFTDDRRKILDALREELRLYNYIPILFDFDKPFSRDTRETLEMLAGMSKYIVADITEPESIPIELASIVSQLPEVPVQPIFQKGYEPWIMYESIANCAWVNELVTFDSIDSFIQHAPKFVAGFEKVVSKA